MSLRSPINPNKIMKALIQDSLLCLIRDALVIPVPALIRVRSALLPTGRSCITAQPSRRRSPLMVIGSLRCGGALDGQLREG